MGISRDPAARRRLAALGTVAIAAAVAGAVAGSKEGSEAPSPPGEPSEPARVAAERLPLPRQVGLLLVSRFEGARLPAYLRLRLRQGTTAGVILFSDNVTTPAGVRSLTRSVQRAARGGALVMVDQEGGLARRIPFAAPEPAQSTFATEARARRSARTAARQLHGLGVNVNLAPVADLPGGPVLGFRAYPGSAHQVGSLVAAAVDAYGRAGVASTAKHYPGLGSAAANTDAAPAVISRSRRALELADMAPFRAAIRAGVPLIMASHALYPAIDRRHIASQSPVLLREILRRRFGFDGVLVTDSIEANAVLRRASVATAAERSIAAGADQVLMTGSASWKLVFPRLLARARSSPAFRARVREAAARVLDLKARLGLRVPGDGEEAGNAGG